MWRIDSGDGCSWSDPSSSSYGESDEQRNKDGYQKNTKSWRTRVSGGCKNDPHSFSRTCSRIGDVEIEYICNGGRVVRGSSLGLEVVEAGRPRCEKERMYDGRKKTMEAFVEGVFCISQSSWPWQHESGVAPTCFPVFFVLRSGAEECFDVFDNVFDRAGTNYFFQTTTTLFQVESLQSRVSLQ